MNNELLNVIDMKIAQLQQELVDEYGRGKVEYLNDLYTLRNNVAFYHSVDMLKPVTEQDVRLIEETVNAAVRQQKR